MDEEKLAELIRGGLEKLEEEYGISRGFTNKSDAVLVMEGWNKVLAFQTEFSEAIFGRWRILVALEELLEQQKNAVATENGESSSKNKNPPARAAAVSVETLHMKACDQVEQGSDPLAKRLGTRVLHGRQLIVSTLDACVRSLCPHTQTVQREAYKPVSEVLQLSPSGFWGMKRFSPQEGTTEEYFRIFARCGVLPSHWVAFCKAFLWACQTHSPYAEEADLEDLEKTPLESANALFVATTVAKEAIVEIKKLHEYFKTPVFAVCIPRFWSRASSSEEHHALPHIGETFYRQLLSNHSELLDFFKNTDMDTLSMHFAVRVLDI